MRNRIYIMVGIITLVLVVASFFVYKVFASENSMYIGDCTPYNVYIQKGKRENTVDISWDSKRRCSGYILYGSEIKNLGMVAVDLENDAESKSHIANLDGLISSKVYYFTIVSNDTSYGKDGLPLQFSINSL